MASSRKRQQFLALVTKVLLVLPAFSWAQIPVAENQSLYRSTVDELLSIRRVSVLAFSDNVGGIYSRPLEAHLVELLKQQHRWDYAPANTAGPILSPEELAESPAKVSQLTSGLKTDAVFASKVVKGPNGISMQLKMFLTADGKVLAEEEIRKFKQFDVEVLKIQLKEMLGKVIRKVPYNARVLSRQNNRVTINLGSRDGLKGQQVLSAIQLLKIKRHPKFNFIISSEKEILGRIKVLKVDETLSFGMIISERERGAIRKDAKISGVDFVKYPDTESLNIGESTEDKLNQREDGKVSFGKNPKAWVPKEPPSYGMVGARLGLGMYKGSTSLNSVGSLDADNPYYPSIFLEGELWVTSSWSVHFGLQQGIISVDNPRSGSSPSDLSQSLTAYEFMLGYNFRMGPSLEGPQVEFLVGYSSYRLFVDNADPEAFMTMEYTGLNIGLKGAFPITRDKKWRAGAQLYIVLNPSLSESPATSGASATNTVNKFGLFGSKKLGERLRVIGQLDFALYSSSFSGSGSRAESASSSSQRHTTLSGGVQYLF